MHRSHILLASALALVMTTLSFGQVGPDVTVLSLDSMAKNGTVGDITAYSTRTESCNRGDVAAIWIDPEQNPLIAGNIYRIDGNGLLSQLGMSWLKHGFFALDSNACGTCQATGGDSLGVNCSDIYGASLNGSQGNLGPRSTVNASTGEYTPIGSEPTGNAIFKRIQCQNDDIDPALNPGATYFGHGQYITVDETAWGNMFNNNTWQQLLVGNFSNGGWALNYTGPNHETEDPIQAWQFFDPSVQIVELMTPEDAGLGQVIIGSRVEDLGGGVYRYQYAIYNNNSHRSIRELSIPLPAGIALSNIEFHDVDYHSGEPYDNVPWTMNQSASDISWSTGTGANNNALRWGTTYSFAFDANAAPQTVTATLGLYRASTTGQPNSLTFSTTAPDGNFITPISNLTCVPTFDMTQLTWTNGQSYDSLEVSRDGSLLATLGGGATSFTDTNPPEGAHTYSVNAISGVVQSGAVSCSITTPPPPPLAFDFISESVNADYDSGTGAGSFSVSLSVLEDAANVIYPNTIRGLSMGLGVDGTLIAPSSVTQSPTLASMNSSTGPEFFATEFYSNGMTVGVYFSFTPGDSILATSTVDVVTVAFDTNAATLAGNTTGATTQLTWQDGLGGVPVVNTVLLDNSDSATPSFVHGTVNLTPIAGPPRFIRGDCNQDMSVDISDPIHGLGVQFLGEPTGCIDACDSDDSGALSLPDALTTLNYLFAGSAPLPAPFPNCGEDTTASALDCSSPACP